MTEPLPAEFPDYNGRRRLLLEPGGRPGQVKVQVAEGEAFSRGAILAPQEAQAAAWSILAAVHDAPGVGS